MKIKMGYVCPNGVCTHDSAKFSCGYPYLTKQRFEFSLSDFFTNETFDAHANIEGDLLIFNKTSGHDWKGRTKLYGTYRLNWKMKLADDPNNYIAQIEYLMEASWTDLMNRAEYCYHHSYKGTH